MSLFRHIIGRGRYRLMPVRHKMLMMTFIALGFLHGCVRYSFTGVTIPSDVRTVYIPFFPDQTGGGIGDLSDQLNEALVNRFVNQTRLQLTDSADDADVIFDGTITSFSSQPFSVAGNQQANLNRVQISVRASYQYSREEQPEWDKSFSGNFEYDPNVDPVDGENAAISEALDQIANNMFNDAMGNW